MRIEDMGIEASKNECVSASDVMIRINVMAGRARYHCHANSLREAIDILEDGIERGILWGGPEAAFVNVTNLS